MFKARLRPLDCNHFAFDPSNFAPGKARYRVVSSYVCNPLHNISPIVTEARDIEFGVVE